MEEKGCRLETLFQEEGKNEGQTPELFRIIPRTYPGRGVTGGLV